MGTTLTGKHIELISTAETGAELKPGDRGVIEFVDDTGIVYANWENGSRIWLVPGEDKFKILKRD